MYRESARPRPQNGYAADGNRLRLQEIYLEAGQTRASRDPLLLSMMVGSSVAVCLFDHALAIGGATHFLLPAWHHGSGKRSSRYGDVAIEEVVEQLRKLGSKTRNLTARIFGGACMFQSFRDHGRQHVGRRNTDIALEILSRCSIPVIEKDIAGNFGRKVRMWTNTGAIQVEVVGE